MHFSDGIHYALLTMSPRKKYHPILKITLFLLLFLATERFCHKQTGGFQLHKILSKQALDPSRALPSLPEEDRDEIRALVAQPFYFLGHGGQSYAFVSEDGTTVLKFFKQHHIRFWNWLSRLSLPSFLQGYREKMLAKMQHQSPFLIESCKISYLEFREHTGLIYLHLQKTDFLPKKVKLIDKLGIAHEIALDETDFALQKKAELFRPKLRKLLQNKDLSAAKQCIRSLLDLMIDRSQKGIADRDPNIRRNMGFVGNQAIEIDLGSYNKIPVPSIDPQSLREELMIKTSKLKQWLDHKSPELSHFLTEQIECFAELSPQCGT